jgi:hypothetical protein
MDRIDIAQVHELDRLGRVALMLGALWLSASVLLFLFVPQLVLAAVPLAGMGGIGVVIGGRRLIAVRTLRRAQEALQLPPARVVRDGR